MSITTHQEYHALKERLETHFNLDDLGKTLEYEGKYEGKKYSVHKVLLNINNSTIDYMGIDFYTQKVYEKRKANKEQFIWDMDTGELLIHYMDRASSASRYGHLIICIKEYLSEHSLADSVFHHLGMATKLLEKAAKKETYIPHGFNKIK